MTAEATADPAPPVPGRGADYQILRTVHGAALFVDVRKSSQIIDFVERHFGPEGATALFMNFLAGVMSSIDGPTVWENGPSGDAVLAVFTGEACASDAVDAAGRAIDFVRNDFLRDNGHYLTCTGSCGLRECPGAPAFQAGAGVDDGVVTSARIQVGRHDSVQLVGACINFASKLSGAAPPNTIAVSTGMFHRVPALAENYFWEAREMVVGKIRRRVVLVDPPR